jgi:glycine/D-amino acid oxidase-like deaminating enzyme
METDVCIIGDGFAGAFLANILAERHRNVVVLQAEPSARVSSHDAGFETDSPRACTLAQG